tara:strand:+ start:11880 stop:12806 length:927 start_codon:yes stop_codon:yes gene_type:complete
METKWPVGPWFGMIVLEPIRPGHAKAGELTKGKTMRRIQLGTSAVILALMGAIGTGALAQDQAPATAQSSPQTQLPQVLGALNLTDIATREARHGGNRIEGNLPGGGEIQAVIDESGNLVMVDVDDAAMPQSLIDAMLPQSVRDNAVFGQFATIGKLATMDSRVMIGGEDADGEDLRAGFDAEGRLLRFGREDGDGRRFGRGPERGEHGGKDESRKGRGPGMMGGHDGDREGPRGGDRRGERPGEGPGRAPMMDRAAIDKVLGDAGYTDLAQPRRAGPRFALDATNPAGEQVTLEIDAKGDILRETAR